MDYPIRILHIVSIMNRGGLETFIMNTYRNIDRKKVQFDFLVNREESGVYDDEIQRLGGRRYNIPHIQKVGYKRHKKIFRDFLIEHNNYKTIHSHVNELSGIYLREAKKIGIPVRISHSHNTKSCNKFNLKGILKLILRKYSKSMIIHSATDYFACSNAAANWLYGKAITNEKSIIVKNGIDTQKFTYDAKIRLKKRLELGAEDKTFLIGNVASFTSQKNHIGLIDIFHKTLNKIPYARLCLVGDGDLKDDIYKEVKKRGIEDKVLFLGLRDDINELMMSFDVFLLPSLYEGLPVVLVEAQTTGVNCIVSSSVTNEVDLGLDLVHFIDNSDINMWIDMICKINKKIKKSQNNRTSDINKISKIGYDINTTSKLLEDIYTLDKEEKK